MIKKTYDWITEKVDSTESIDFFPFYLDHQAEDRDAVDNNDLKPLEKTFFLCIRSCILPLREGLEFWREPYYANRFARQFGYD